MILQSLAGLPAFLVYFCTAIVAVVAYRRRAATSSAAIPHQAVRGPALYPIPVRAASPAAVSARLRARSRRIFPAAVDQPAACRTML
jgi:hypothetical protein